MFFGQNTLPTLPAEGYLGAMFFVMKLLTIYSLEDVCLELGMVGEGQGRPGMDPIP